MDFAERKRKVEHLLRVKYPFSWAPPPINALRPGGHGGDHGAGVDRHALHARMMKTIEAERQRLMALADSELETAFATAKTVEESKAAMKEEIAEKGRFFSHAPAEADFAYWAKVEYWSLDESVALLLGKSPEVVNWGSIKSFVNISAFAKQYERLRNLALRAQQMNRGQSGIYPSAVLAWAADLDIPVPAALAAAIEARVAKKRALASLPALLREHDGILAAFNERPAREGDTAAALSSAPPPVGSQALGSWNNVQPAPSHSREPVEYVHVLTLAAGQKMIALASVPTMTAHAVQQETWGEPHNEDIAEDRLLFAVTEQAHRDKLRDAVLTGQVVPWDKSTGMPSPRRWEDDPRAGLLLPVGELRKFADLLLMDVKVETRETPAAQGPEEVAAAEPPEATEAGPQASVVHTLATRRDVLDPVIDLAEKTATNADDRAAVWNALTALAVAKDKLHPLLGFADRSVQYLDGDEPKFLTRDAFNKRWDRRKERAATNRR